MVRNLAALLLAAFSLTAQTSDRIISVIPKADGTSVGELRLYEIGADYITLKAPAVMSSSPTWVWPGSDSAGALCSDGLGTLYFGCVGGGSPMTASAPITIVGVDIRCLTCTTVTGSPTTNNVPFWTGTGNGLSNTGLAVAVAGTNNSLAQRSSSGQLFATDFLGSTLQLAGSSSGNVTISTQTAAGTWTFKLPINDGNAGEFLQTDGGGNTSWAAVSGSSGVVSLNGLTGALNMITGTAGTAPAFSASGATITLDIPQASTASVLRGTISNTDYNTFNGKQATMSASSPISIVGVDIRCTTCATVSGSVSTNNVPFWTGSGNALSNTGLAVAVAGTNNSLAQRSSSGQLFATDLLASTLQLAGSSSGTVTVSTQAAAGTWTLKLPTSPGTSGHFLQTDGAGNTTWAAATGSGGIGGSGTVGQVAEFVTNSTTLTSRAYASTTAGTANAVLKTGTNKEVFAYDYGANVFNAVAYGADPSGSGDSTTAINNTLNACETTTGGIVYIPGGTYKINATLHLGNGSASGQNTLKPCSVIGAGGGNASNPPAGTTISWDTGTSPGSTTYMFDYRGPYEGGGLENITFETNSKNLVLPIRLGQVQHFRATGVDMNHTTGGPAMTFQPVRLDGSGVVNGCRSTFDRITVNNPGSGGEGILFADGTYTVSYNTGTISTTGASQFITGSGTSWTNGMSGKTIIINGLGYYFYHDTGTGDDATHARTIPAVESTLSGVSYAIVDGTSGDHCQVHMSNVTSYGATYGMHVIFADNIYIERSELHGTTGQALKFTRSSSHAAFPHENTFISLSAVEGVGGSVGYAQANVFLDYKLGDCSGGTATTTCLPTFTSGTTPILQVSGESSISFQPYISGYGSYRATPVATSSLPTCNAAAAGKYAAISDGLLAPTPYSNASGGGSNNRPVFCDGSSWIYP